MNEQDLLKQLDEQTKNITIPDSISPMNMKKMLDQQCGEWNSFSEDASQTSSNNNTLDNNKQGISKHNQIIRRFTVAACLTLCFVGGMTAIHFNNKSTDTNVYFSESAEESCEEDAVAEESVETAEENMETTDDTTTNQQLVQQSSLQSPSSYDAYYKTLSSAYQKYYDSLASVTTDDIASYEGAMMEKLDGGIKDYAVSEDAVEESETNSSATISFDTSDAMSEDSKQRANKEYSSTNTQEKKVDEGDIIKTDGTYIYKVISRYDDTTGYTKHNLTITKTDNGNLEALATIDLNELLENPDSEQLNFHEFYLYKNYIVLMYTKEHFHSDDISSNTHIVIYDVTNKEKPKKARTMTQSGWYESSRISDGFLYTISNFNEATLETPTPYTNYIPSVNGKTIECSDIYYPRDILMQTTYVITSLNLSNLTDFADTASIPTNGGQIYVSDSSIYFYRTLYDKVTKTEIAKIHYNQGILTPGNSATITGYLYGTFALSEYANHLRIVATIPANNISLLRDIVPLGGSASKEESATDTVTVKEDVNVLYILNDSMELVSKLSGIAPGEQIYSARFMGDIGYFVTFKNVDPLFSVDLSDPANPSILGQLKVPGFSHYLHSYDDGLLLGFGEEINPETGEFVGLKLSMFDVSDPANVSEQDKYIIKDGEYSEAQYNHKAIMIDPNKNIFGFIYGGYHSGSYQYYYVTYTYDNTDGFIETARYPITDGSEYETNSVRGVYIGDYLYIATNKSITSYKIGSTNPIAHITLK